MALLGTKRKNNTYKLLLQIREILSDKGIELEVVELYKYNIQSCNGCDVCNLKGSCVIKDDVLEIMEKLSKADGIILASPVYLKQVTGKMKSFFDRTCSWYHRPVLTAKPVLCVSTTKGSGLNETLEYMESVACQWGAITAGGIGRSIFNIKKPVTEKEVSKFIMYMENPKIYSPSISQLISFQVEKALAKKLNGIDVEYWEERGWMDKPYFYECRINPVKKGISEFTGYVIRKGMSKGETLEDVLQREKSDRINQSK